METRTERDPIDMFEPASDQAELQEFSREPAQGGGYRFGQREALGAAPVSFRAERTHRNP